MQGKNGVVESSNMEINNTIRAFITQRPVGHRVIPR